MGVSAGAVGGVPFALHDDAGELLLTRVDNELVFLCPVPGHLGFDQFGPVHCRGEGGDDCEQSTREQGTGRRTCYPVYMLSNGPVSGLGPEDPVGDVFGMLHNRERSEGENEIGRCWEEGLCFTNLSEVLLDWRILCGVEEVVVLFPNTLHNLNGRGWGACGWRTRGGLRFGDDPGLWSVCWDGF